MIQCGNRLRFKREAIGKLPVDELERDRAISRVSTDTAGADRRIDPVRSNVDLLSESHC